MKPLFFTFRFAAVSFGLFFLPGLVEACSGRLHIEVQQSGVYSLDYASIAEKQPGLGDCANADLMLTNNGREIPLRVVSTDHERFGAGDRIEWVGERLHGPQSWFDPYATANVYFLSAAPGRHARMQEISSNDAASAQLARTVHLELENLMIRLTQQQVKPGEEPDVWFWAKLTHVDPQPFTVNFDLPDLARREKTIHAVLNFRGLSEIMPRGKIQKPADHHVDIMLNGNPLPALSWEGRDETKKIIDLPLAQLKPKNNSLTLRVPKRTAPWDKENPLIDVVMFNFIELNYAIEGNFDLSDQPFLLAGEGEGAAASFQATATGQSTPAVYSADGRYFPARAVAKSWRFTGAPRNMPLYASLNNRYLSPSLVRKAADDTLHGATPGYDYLIIVHPRLIDAIQPLAEFHRGRGLKVAIVDVNHAYDEFNYGIQHPQALRNLIDYGYRNWTLKPRYVLLVGDASFDIRHEHFNETNYAKWSTQELLYPGQFGSIPATPYPNAPKDLPNRNLIPTWQFPSPEGQSASDNWFVALNDKDFHPVLAIGRFPVVEPSEVEAIVKKTIQYQSKPQLGSWRRDVMFIADETEYFKSSSDQIAAQLDSEGFAAHKIYASAAEKDNLSHQADIKQELNQGQLLVHFIGHGGRFIWRTGPPDLHKNHDLFTLEDVSSLNDSSRLPMVLSMTCYSAPFDNPSEDSIGERFLREPDKGAIAVFAASWRNSPQPEYSKALITELLKPGMPIGDAIVTGKKKMTDRTLVETYNLLGDPALVLARPKSKLKLSLSGTRWDPHVDVAIPGGAFHGQINADWIDADGKVLETHQYQIELIQFALPMPSAANLAKAVELRVYAADYERGEDAIGQLRLIDDKKPEAIKPTAPAPTKTAPKATPITAMPTPSSKIASDGISRLGFENTGTYTLAGRFTP